jgi:apolipoprotein N-acyltransferase
MIPLFIILLSALLAIFSHPAVFFGYRFPNLGFLAWVAYVPLLLLLSKKSGWQQWKAAFFFGVLFYSGATYWLYTAMNQFGKLSPAISVIVLMILVVILAAFFSIIFPLSRFIEQNLKIPRFWSLPLVWVGVEWFRSHWPLGGFPWCQLGYSQAGYPSFIQFADLTGVYGVTAMVVWGNLALVEVSSFKSRVARHASLFSFIALIIAVVIYGSFAQSRISQEIKSSPKFRVGLLQGNIPQDEKWLVERAPEIIQTYQTMTHQAFFLGADIALWPEASYPYDLSLDRPEDLKLLGEYPKDVVIGAVTYESWQLMHSGIKYVPLGIPIHNTAFLIHTDAEKDGVYHKQHLVPYGESIPLKKYIPFLGKLTAQVGEFEPGSKFTLLNSGEAKLGMLICYEDIFPEISRGHVNEGANLLANLSNDAWYGDSSALPQHLSFSIFRAIENRRSLIRSTNTGLTATVDPLGRIQKILSPFHRDILIDEVSLMSHLSFYSKRGDLFAYACLGLTGVMLIWSVYRRYHPENIE